MKKFTIPAIVIFLVAGSFIGGFQVGKKRALPVPKLPSKDYIPAIKPEWFVDLPKFVKSIKMDEQYYFVIEDKGRVTDIDRKGKLVGGKVIFPLGIKLKSGEIDDWVWLSPDLFHLLEVDIITDGVSRPGNVDDVKIGQSVTLQEIVDLGYGPSDRRHSKAFVVKIMK